MSLPTIVVNSTLVYPGNHGKPSHCRIRLYDSLDLPVVVVISEAHDNPGTSITNAIEDIAERVLRLFGLDREDTLWIEHYPGHKGKPQDQGGERFCRVTFQIDPFRGRYELPEWSIRTRAHVEHLIGRPLKG